MSVIALVFLLIALLMVLATFFPAWNFAAGPAVAINRVIGLLIGLVILYIVYLIVMALFGGVAFGLHAMAAPLMVGVLDTNTTPEHDPIAPKPFYLSKTFWLGVILTVVGASTYFGDPQHTPTLTLASISEAVGGVAAIVLRVWFTTAPIQGTPAAAQVETALIQKTATG